MDVSEMLHKMIAAVARLHAAYPFGAAKTALPGLGWVTLLLASFPVTFPPISLPALPGALEDLVVISSEEVHI